MINRLIISIFYLGVFTLNCNSQKTENGNELLAIGALMMNSNNEDVLLPAEIASISPANAATYSLDWNDLGTKAFNAGVYSNSHDPMNNGNVQIRRILPTTKLILEVQFTEDVSQGTISVTRRGNSVAGNFLLLNSRTARFESTEAADLADVFPYSATASGFTKVSDNVQIRSVTWQFRTNFSGSKSSETAIAETCTIVAGKNNCAITAVQRMPESLQDVAKANDLTYLKHELSYRNSGINLNGLFSVLCEHANGASIVTRKAQSKEYWFLETLYTLLDVPALPTNPKTYQITSTTDISTSHSSFSQSRVFTKN